MKKIKIKNSIIPVFYILCCIILFCIPTGFEGAMSRDSFVFSAKVISVDNNDLRQNLIVYTGTQDVDVRILEGPHKDIEAHVVNPLSGKLEFDEIYEKGDIILIEYKIHKGKIHMAFTRGFYRITHEIVLIILFIIFLIVVAGTTGLKALLSFLFSGLMIWKLLIPLFLKNINPILVALIVVAALTASVSFLIGGWTHKGLTSFFGSFAGLIVACVLSIVFSSGFHLNGAVRPFAENLLYGGFAHLNIKDIFLSGIFIACSGAVMDLSMDIAASMDEIKTKKPDIHFWELFRSGINVGRSVVGTMTTTLLLAYSGGYTAMLMNFMSQGLALKNIFNMKIVAAEILNVFVGSFGLVAVAPFTAFFGALLFSNKISKK